MEPVPAAPIPITCIYFTASRPDLVNPALRREIYQMVNWWLDKGHCGLQVDAIVNIGKPDSFRDYPPTGPDGLADCCNMLASPAPGAPGRIPDRSG